MKLTMANLIIALLFALPNFSHAENPDPNLRHVTIVGKDDRVEAKDSSAIRRKLAESTVALFKADSLEFRSNSWWIKRPVFVYWEEPVLKAAHPEYLYSEFKNTQTSNGFASGVLVGDDLVLTTGHAFQPMKYLGVEVGYKCADMKFVFSNKLPDNGHAPVYFEKQDVYSCKEIIRRSVESSEVHYLCEGEVCQHFPIVGAGPDYALVRLDRKVENNAQPLAISRKPVKSGDELFEIGYPEGYPVKVSEVGYVIELRNRYFRHTVDTQVGNSGSPVFDAKTLKIVGIEAREYEAKDSNDSFHEATSVLEIADLIPETQMERDINAILERKAQRRWEKSGEGYKPIPAVTIPGVVNPEPAVFHPSAVPEPQPAHGI